MGPRAIFRYEVPVDDRWHTLNLHGPVLAVDCRRLDRVELWAMHYDHEDDAPFHAPQEYCVVGTGHPLPDDAGEYIGTAMDPSGQLVWHLMRRT